VFYLHLKRLEIQGFKSFADRIQLEFNSGITAVVDRTEAVKATFPMR